VQRPKSNKPPLERHETVRQSIAAALRDHTLTARELSALVGVEEKEIAGHLEHLARSLPASGVELVIEPARCAACGFEFQGRRRATRPSRCPECKRERIRPPAFKVRAGST
jgi:transcriptional regulator